MSGKVLHRHVTTAASCLLWFNRLKQVLNVSRETTFRSETSSSQHWFGDLQVKRLSGVKIWPNLVEKIKFFRRLVAKMTHISSRMLFISSLWWDLITLRLNLGTKAAWLRLGNTICCVNTISVTIFQCVVMICFTVRCSHKNAVETTSKNNFSTKFSPVFTRILDSLTRKSLNQRYLSTLCLRNTDIWQKLLQKLVLNETLQTQEVSMGQIVLIWGQRSALF